IDGWYVLPGGTRRYEVPLPAADCPKVRSLGIEVQTTRATLTERVDAPEGACVPGRGRLSSDSPPAGLVPPPGSCAVCWAPRSPGRAGRWPMTPSGRCCD